MLCGDGLEMDGVYRVRPGEGAAGGGVSNRKGSGGGCVGVYRIAGGGGGLFQ